MSRSGTFLRLFLVLFAGALLCALCVFVLAATSPIGTFRLIEKSGLPQKPAQINSNSEVSARDQANRAVPLKDSKQELDRNVTDKDSMMIVGVNEAGTVEVNNFV
jgi:hypothetical protein